MAKLELHVVNASKFAGCERQQVYNFITLTKTMSCHTKAISRSAAVRLITIIMQERVDDKNNKVFSSSDLPCIERNLSFKMRIQWHVIAVA